MKTSTIPPIRVEPALRQEIEASLAKGETIATLVEQAVRTELNRRNSQAGFVRRGIASITRSEQDGDWIPAEAVLAKLEGNVDAAKARQKLGRKWRTRFF